MRGNRRFLPLLSEAEIPPAGVRRKPVVAAGHSEEGIGEVCRRRHGFRNFLRISVSRCKKSGRISRRFWFVEKPWALT